MDDRQQDYEKRKYAADLIVSNVGRPGSRSEPVEGLPVLCRLIRLLAAALSSPATAKVLARHDAGTLLVGRISDWQCSSLSGVLRDAYLSLFIHNRRARSEALHTKLHLPMLEAALMRGIDSHDWELVRDVIEAFQGYFTHSSSAIFAAFCAMDSHGHGEDDDNSSSSGSGLIRLWALLKRMHSAQDRPGDGEDDDNRLVKSAVQHSAEQVRALDPMFG